MGDPNATYQPPAHNQQYPPPTFSSGGSAAYPPIPQASTLPPPVYQEPAYNSPPPSFQDPPKGGSAYGGSTPLLSGGRQTKFGPATFQDIPFALAFFACCLATLLIIATSYNDSYLGRDGSKDDVHSSSDTDDGKWRPKEDYHTATVICAVSMFIGMAVTLFWVQFIKRFPRQVILFTLSLNFFMCIFTAIVCLAGNNIVGALVAMFGGIISALFFFFWRRRIDFASTMLETTVSVLTKYPGVIVVSFGAVGASILMSVTWGLAVICALSYENEDTRNAIVLFLIFSWLWAAQVIKNTTHVTCAGTYATWYFLGSDVPSNPTTSSLKRACTTSFGSICFGSLLIAAIQLLRFIVHSARNNGRRSNGAAFVLACAECIIRCFQDILDYFNIYAFSQVAIYGKSYCNAAKDTWALFSSNGIDILVNDDLIGPVLVLTAWLAGLMNAAIACLWSITAFGTEGTGPSFIVGCTTFAFLAGALICAIVMEGVRSGVACLFVCFAESPEPLARNQPILYNKLKDTYRGRIGFFN